MLQPSLHSPFPSAPPRLHSPVLFPSRTGRARTSLAGELPRTDAAGKNRAGGERDGGGEGSGAREASPPECAHCDAPSAHVDARRRLVTATNPRRAGSALVRLLLLLLLLLLRLWLQRAPRGSPRRRGSAAQPRCGCACAGVCRARARPCMAWHASVLPTPSSRSRRQVWVQKVGLGMASFASPKKGK
eukprot:25027-Chlamydomonas_euryale.AAC.4